MGRGPCVHSQCTPFGLFVPVLFLTWMWAQRFGHHYLDNFGSMRPALSAGGKFSAMLATATNSIHMESPSPRGSPRAHLGSFKLLPSAPVWLPEVMAKICPGHGEPHGGGCRELPGVVTTPNDAKAAAVLSVFHASITHNLSHPWDSLTNRTPDPQSQNVDPNLDKPQGQ